MEERKAHTPQRVHKDVVEDKEYTFRTKLSSHSWFQSRKFSSTSLPIPCSLRLEMDVKDLCGDHHIKLSGELKTD